MKVLQVIDRLNTGGAEKVFLTILKLLAENGIQADALLFQTGYPLDKQIDKRAKVYNLDRKNKYSLLKLYKTHRICSGYDIVHVHMRHCYTYVRLAQLLFRGKYNLILHDHYGDIQMDKRIPLTLQFLKPQNYIGVSHTLRSWAINNLGIHPSKAFLLTNTIVPGNRIVSNQKAKIAFLISNLRHTKNIEFAINLFKNSDWELTIYGNKTDEVYYRMLTALIGNHSGIKIVEGITDFSSVYGQYSLAVHCSKSETGPLVLLEYLANGIPFIAYKTGEVAEIVSNELPKLFMDTFDENAWVQRIDEITSMNNLPRQLQAAFQKYFSPHKYVEKCLDIYNSVNS